MKSYEERHAEAQGIYQEGLKRVKNDPEPEGQKFPCGSFVKIAKDLGSSMRHFTNDTYARVVHTYPHAYPNFGGSVKDYSLLVRYAPNKWGEVSWYHEHQLERVDDAAVIQELENELKALNSQSTTVWSRSV